MNAVEKLNAFQRFGSVLGLERMEALLEKLDHPERGLNVIHVAGTNGKGSICRYIYEVLEEAGCKVGLYTSPFIERFNERIEVDHQMIPEDALDRLTDLTIEKANEIVREGNDSPTEFEVITAIAFLYFKETGCDPVILEVGLGGRGDSTNIVEKPLCSVIGTISLDHMAVLGDTIAKIAFEKAGIIKEGCPVVIGSKHEDAKEVFRKRCRELHAELIDATEFPRTIRKKSLEGQVFDTEVLGVKYPSIELSTFGDYQVDNAVTALTCLTLLKERGVIDFSDAELRNGMRRAHQIGRLEVMARDPFVIIDGAHNPEGAAGLEQTAREYFDGKEIRMVVGILADKDVDGILDCFLGITKDFIATEPVNPRKLSADALAEKIRARGGTVRVAEKPEDAVDLAFEDSDGLDVILFAGSLYLIGEVRRLLRERK